MQHWTAPVAQIQCTDVGIDKKKKKGVQGGCRKWEKGIIAESNKWVREETEREIEGCK